MKQQVKYDNFYTPKNNEFYSKFHYVNLKPEERRIRLLRIQSLKPGEDKGHRIKCELIDNQSLAAMQGKFTTLSYCAGDPKKTETIVVNGLEFNAFSNLGHALRQVRHFWKEKYDTQELLLWTDQVCINQSNPNERSHQVSFMGDIYGSAIQVLVCLSVEGDRSGGIRWLQQFASEFREYKQNQPDNECASDSDDHEDHGENFFLQKYDGESFHCGWDTCVATIFKSPWWSRAWIRQEYLRSPDAYFLAANESAHWEAATEAVDIFYNAAYGIDLFWDEEDRRTCPSSSRRSSDACQACLHAMDCSEFRYAGKCASTLLNLKKKLEISMPYPPNLLDRLKDMHLCETSDPRDLVYACFGISGQNYGLYPDYTSSISLQDVFIKVAQNVITHCKSLNILRRAYLTRVGSSRSDLPSWVPDWRNISRTQEGHFHTLPSRSTDFFTFHPDSRGRPSRILQVRGAQIGVIGQKEDRWSKVISCPGGRVPLVGYAKCSDEVHLLHGFGNLFVLRRQNEYFKVVGEVLGLDGILPGVNLLVDDLEQMVERNDPAVLFIDIC